MTQNRDPDCKWIEEFGVRRRLQGYILDGFDSDFYLYFDDSIDQDRPEVRGTVDIHVVPIGHHTSDGIRVLSDCKRHQVMRFLFALGVSRFGEKTKSALYATSNPLRVET